MLKFIGSSLKKLRSISIFGFHRLRLNSNTFVFLREAKFYSLNFLIETQNQKDDY